MYNQYEQNTTAGAIRKLAGSALFLVGAIGYSMYLIFELLRGITGTSEMMDLLYRAMESSGAYASLDYETIDTFYSVMNGASVFSTIMSMLPAILILAGIWMVFAAAKRNSLPGAASAGLTMIRVIVIIQLVMFCIAVVIIGIICLIALIGVGAMSDYYSGDFSPLLILGLLVLGLAVVAILQILYYAKLSGTIGRIKRAMVTGQADGKASGYVQFICWLAAIVTILSCVVSLISLSVFGILSQVGLALANICFAILLSKYNNSMNMTMYNGQQPYQAQPQAAPRQPYQAQPQAAPQQPYQAQPQAAPQQPYQAQPQAAPQQPYQAQPQAAPQQPYQAQPQPAVQQPEAAAPGETEALPYYNETTVLSGQMVNDGVFQLVRLIRQKTGEAICINKASFWFGKEAGNVDYCITDNTAISRRHAVITIRNNECYIQDNHSTNHVFVNGHMIQAGADTPIVNGDRVRMSDEEFIVSIE